ncbi:DivIVA domain-containing protein [Brooklawnia sp.]|uniref:DivIVA domain-containing protein n=1 Tax=Brooklawnia sp. TaxID=2699740 RepID=UPI00311D5B79
MGWFFAALMVVIVGFVFFVAAGRGGEMAPQIDDRPVPRLPDPDRPLTSSDLDQLSFAVVTRGYSMEQVDAVLDLLSTQLSAAAPSDDNPRTGSPVDPGHLGEVPNGWPANLGSEPSQPAEAVDAE